MKKVSMFSILFVLLGTLLLSACSSAEPRPVQALADEPTVQVIVAPTDTASPLPTDTSVPASPTASRIEFPVGNASLEVRVLEVEKPYHVNLGWDANLGKDLSFTAGAGQMFLVLGIKVTNLTGSDITMKWTDLSIVNKYQDKWYPTWGAYQKSNQGIDPHSVEILKYDQVNPDFDPDAHFYVGDNGYVRVIFQLPKDNLYYFLGFADLPLIEINWRYY